MNLRVCPLPTSIADQPVPSCEVDWDQIIMMIFQRKNSATLFSPTTFLALATWTPMLTAADDTKVVSTPKFAELVFPESTALTQGGNDNTTIAGIPQYNGEGFVPITAKIPGQDAAIKKALKTLTTESIANSLGQSGLTVYFVNRFGQIVGNKTSTTKVEGFPVYNFRISSTGSDGYNARNKYQIGFDMLGDWDDNAVLYTPAFDPLTSIHQ